MTGVGSLLYLLVTLNEVVVTGHLRRLLAAIRMQRTIADLRDHYVICGYGRVGRRIAAHLREDEGQRRAGATDVVSPYRASGDEMARLALAARGPTR